jgi:hypothetical protein
VAFSGEVTDDESGLEKVTDVFGVGGDHDGHRDPVVRRRPQRGDRVMYGTGMEPSRIKATTGRSGAASRAPTATGSPKLHEWLRHRRGVDVGQQAALVLHEAALVSRGDY